MILTFDVITSCFGLGSTCSLVVVFLNNQTHLVAVLHLIAQLSAAKSPLLLNVLFSSCFTDGQPQRAEATNSKSHTVSTEG